MKSKRIFVVIGVFLIVLCNSIVYCTLNTDMFIDGDAYVRVDRNIRVTGIKVIEQIGGAYETYNCDYSKDTTSIQVTLPSSDSSIVYEITIANKGDIDYEVTDIMEESYLNNNINYEIIDLEKGTVVDGGTTCIFKIKLTTIENDPENKGTLVLKYDFQEWIPSLYNMVAHKSRSLDTNLDFGVAPTKETSGVYEIDSTKDDEYPVYYYRGMVENNNVSFAGFCWKAVRTTSTGGVKLIYNGVPGSDGGCDNTSEASQIGMSYFNSSYNNPKYIGYTYDTNIDSTVKKVIDKWYSDNMIEYTGMLEDTEWCNDRSVTGTSGSTIYYGARERNFASYKPSIVCPNTSDKYTVSSSKGNGLLKYPVALLTADEATLAGHGERYYASTGYLYTGQNWWVLSPFYFDNSHATEFSVDNSGDLYFIYVNNLFGVRPTVSLLFDTMISSGNGSVSKPYKLVENKIQKEWVFDYTGGEQEFKVPYDGVYKLEVWGAQGGNSTKSENYRGGYGAYAMGNIEFKREQKLYVNIGGHGKSIELGSIEGGYNGGGLGFALGYVSTANTASDTSSGSGGGATHIALQSGTLASMSSFLDEIIIVAGGGGGGCWHNSDNSGTGGNAGGIIGGNTTNYGVHTTVHNRIGIGGIQNEKVCNKDSKMCSDFGIGGNAWSSGGGGGGSGYYGGTDGSMTGGGGGSSYIGNHLLSDKVMYCYNCQESTEESTKTNSTTNVSEEPISNYSKKGNGYAKITFLE